MGRNILYFVFIITILFHACKENEGKVIDQSHPTPLNIPNSDQTADILKISETVINFRENALKAKVEKSKIVYEIENSDINFEEPLTMIDDMDITTSGEMFLLDKRRSMLIHFDSSGSYTGRIGRKGRGPGEFMNAQQVRVYNDSLLLVSDLTKIELFDIYSQTKHIRTVNMQHGVSSICSVGDTLFTFSNQFLHHRQINSNSVEEIIHAYKIKSFDHLYSFGKSYKSSYPDIVQRLTAGNISCDEYSGTVFFLFQFVPVMHAYSAENGNLKWSIRFDDLFLPKVKTELNDDGIRFSYSTHDATNDYFLHPVSINDQYLLLQISRSFQDKNEDDFIASFIIDSATGKGTYVSNDLPHIMAVSGQYFGTKNISNYFPSAKLMTTN